MKRLAFALIVVLLGISFPTSLGAAKVEVEGKAWLDSQKDRAEINVNGVWDSEEWGTFHLKQSEGSRDVSRQWRRLRPHRRSQRQAPISAFFRKAHRGILRDLEP